MDGRPKGQTGEPVVAKYHQPQVAVIIPYYNNYAAFIAEALLSVQQQTYRHFRCILVDDRSDDQNFRAAEQAVADLGDDRFQLIRADQNRGQIPAVYLGLDQTSADFACVLDPDDRYAPTFLERMLGVHLNSWLFCPIASCDQYFLNLQGGVLTGTSADGDVNSFSLDSAEQEKARFAACGFHRFIGPQHPGWHWASTSSMMFRTAALGLIRPARELSYKVAFDGYAAQGAHMMGGSLVLREPLVYRGLHDHNDFIRKSMFSMYQTRKKDDRARPLSVYRTDALEAFLHNGGLTVFDADDVRDLIIAQFRGAELAELLRTLPLVAEIFGLSDADAVPADADI